MGKYAIRRINAEFNLDVAVHFILDIFRLLQKQKYIKLI